MENQEKNQEINKPLEVGAGVETIETSLNDSNESKVEETPQAQQEEMPDLSIPILSYSDVKTFRYQDGVISKVVRYAYLNGEVLLCADDFLEAVVGKVAKYHQFNELEKMGIDAMDNTEKKSGCFVSMQKIDVRLFSYDIAPAKYERNPENFAPYVRFVANGGMNTVASQIGVEPIFTEPKDLAYLGIDILEFMREKPAAVKATIVELEKDIPVKVEQPQSQPKPQQEENTANNQHNQNNDLQDLKQIETAKTIELLASKIDEQAKVFESILNAIESNKKDVDSNLKQIETAFNALKNQQNNFSNAFEKLVEIQMSNGVNLKTLSDKIETVETNATEVQQQNDAPSENKLKRILTDQSVWMYLAMVVTAIFLPFTIMGLYKHIHIDTSTWYSAMGVGFLCCAIATIWDASIFFFAVNGKIGMSGFGSLVQVVFFSAKFNLLAILFQDGCGLNGEYWQNLIVIIFAVIYSPLLLANLTHLSVSQKND